MIAKCLGHGIRLATLPAFRKFEDASFDPQTSQNRALKEIVAIAAQGAYGRHHGLRANDQWAAYSEKIPITTYETLQPWIERAVIEREQRILTADPIERVEATSGSSSAVKWIPYTRPMLRTFSHMFSLWVHDLLSKNLYRPETGKVFLCVTGGQPAAADVQHGVQMTTDDRDYLGPAWRQLLTRYVITPEFANSDRPLEDLAEAMVKEPDIEVISFWSPSLLLSVIQLLGVDSARKARRAWPRLQLISCWTAASSSRFVDRLQQLFPEVKIQGKGLLATEAAMTIPLEAAGGCAPLLQDVFFEFEDSAGELNRLHALRLDDEYEIIISTLAGLLRYRPGDRVKVVGFWHETPLLGFVGRAGVTCDLVGEKLTIEFVEREVGEIVDGYFCLMPGLQGYQLWINEPMPPRGNRLAIDIEARLAKSFHYRRAIQLRQLSSVSVAWLPGLAENVKDVLESKRGKSGVFKPPLFLHNVDLAAEVSRELRRRQREHME